MSKKSIISLLRLDNFVEAKLLLGKKMKSKFWQVFVYFMSVYTCKLSIGLFYFKLSGGLCFFCLINRRFKSNFFFKRLILKISNGLWIFVNDF
jgi:hypothetical protein